MAVRPVCENGRIVVEQIVRVEGPLRSAGHGERAALAHPDRCSPLTVDPVLAAGEGEEIGVVDHDRWRRQVRVGHYRRGRNVKEAVAELPGKVAADSARGEQRHLLAGLVLGIAVHGKDALEAVIVEVGRGLDERGDARLAALPSPHMDAPGGDPAVGGAFRIPDFQERVGRIADAAGQIEIIGVPARSHCLLERIVRRVGRCHLSQRGRTPDRDRPRRRCKPMLAN